MDGAELHADNVSTFEVFPHQGMYVPKIVSERLGHATVANTLDVYSHVLPGMQEAAAIQFEDALAVPVELAR